MSDVLLIAEQLRRRVPGGIGTYVRGLVLGLSALATDQPVPPVTLYASSPPRRPDPLESLGPPVRTAGLPGRLLTRAWDAGLLDVPAGFPVVHATSFATPPARRTALVVTVHDLAWRHAPDAYPARGQRWHEAALRRALRRASAVVVPSDQVAAEVTAELAAGGAGAGAVHVVPHGSDHLPAPDDDGAAALLARLGVGGEFVLSVGTLEPRKNLARLVEAYAVARAGLPGPWPLVVVGPEGWGDAAAGLTGRPGVVPAGAVSGGVLASLYRRAALFAYVPLLEGFGLPAIEAMAMGTPVVASPMPSTGGAAMTVDPADVDAVAAALVTVAGDAGVRAGLVEAGRTRAAALTWADSARAHVRLWRSVT